MMKRLTDAMTAKRRHRAKGFEELVAGEKAEFILIVDEAMLPLNFKHGNTSHSYQPKNICEKRSQAAIETSAPQFPRSIMFAAGFSWRGQTRFYAIPKDSKMTGEVLIKSVLRPILFRDVPRLYGKDASKVVLHMDSATSHTCQKTVQWLNDNRIKYITKDQWMPNSPKESNGLCCQWVF